MKTRNSIFYAGIFVLFCLLSIPRGSSALTRDELSFALSSNGNPITGAGNPQSFHNAKKAEHKREYKESELLIKFKPDVPDSQRKKIHEKYGSKFIKKFKSLHIHHVKVKSGLSVEDAIKRYQAEPDVEYAEPNYIVSALKTPNDPNFSALWNLHNTGQTGGTSGADIKASEAWDMTTGSSNVVVAVIDTGVDYTHEDLAENMWVNPGEIPGNGIDDDGNGYADDVYGINVITGTGNPMDDMGHGTHVAGTIGAVGNNGIGVIGVNWRVKIMSCKFLDATGSGDTSGAIECLQYIKALKDKGVNIIATNNSWGGGGYSQALSDAINAQRDILFIAAAGNDTVDNDAYDFYPANYKLPNVISVAATDKYDGMADFSDYGNRSVHVGAPGQDILSTLPAQNLWGITGGYGQLSGTSMATPHVTGLAALIKSQNTGMDWREIKNLILSGGDTITSLDGMTITGKRINAYGSLTCSDKPVFSPLSIPSWLTVGAPVTLTLSALSINCASPIGAVTVTTSEGNSIPLHDDGVYPDLAAGDGIFSGILTLTPTQASEQLVFTFSSSFGTTTKTVAIPVPCFGVVCNDNNACTIDTCDPATGVCVYTPLDCIDNDPCTADSCDSGTGNCVHTPRGGPTCGQPGTPLPNGTKLTITQGVGSSGTTPCSTGSCFGSAFLSDTLFWIDFGPGTDGGFVVGKSQMSGGQESDGGITLPGELTNAFFIWGNYHTFFTAPDGGALNKFNAYSCTGADCVYKTEIKVLNEAVCPFIAPLGSDAGCREPSNCTPEQKDGIWVSDYHIDPEGTKPRTWSMVFNSVVPNGAYGWYQYMPYTFIFRGTVVGLCDDAAVRCNDNNACTDDSCDPLTGACIHTKNDTTPPITSASPVGGKYNANQSVVLSCNDGAGCGCDKIYYTIDGTTPTTASNVYANPIATSVSTTLKYFATDLAGNSEAVKTQTYIINHAPTLGTITPSVATTQSWVEFQTFTALYSDPDGYTDLKYVYFLASMTTTSLSNSIYAMYDRTTNKLYLSNNAGNSWVGSCTPGVAGNLTNSQGNLDCGATNVTGSGNDLTVNWRISPRFSPSPTPKNLYMSAMDIYNLGTGLQLKGNWTIR